MGAGWGFRPAYLRRVLYGEAQCDTILNTSADLRLDPVIRKHIPLEDYGLVSFGYFDYPYNYQSFMRHILSASHVVHGFAGLLAVSRRAWLELENLEDLKRLKRAEDTHLHLAVAGKYPTRHVNTRSLHLRANETMLDHWNRGEAQRRVLGKGAASAFLHSVVMIRPACFAGYCYTRFRE
jgi:hypothetical protein